MKKLILLLCILFALSISFYACSGDDAEEPGQEQVDDNDDDNNDDDNDDDPDNPDNGDDDDDNDDPNPQPIDYEDPVTVTFSATGAEVDNPFADNGVTVTNDSGHVVLTSTITDKELNYVLTGVTENGSVKIYGEYPFNLILNGAVITNPAGAAVNIQAKENVAVTSVDNTNNKLTDGETYADSGDEDMKGTFFSEASLTFGGKGSLEVRGKNKHAICSDGGILISEGAITVKEAASDAIHSNDYIRMDGGTVTTTSVGEGFDTDGYAEIYGGALDITTTGQKGQGIKTKGTLTVNTTGTIDIAASGAAAKGFKPKGDMLISAGTINITTTGDAYYDADEADTSSASGIKCDSKLQIDGGTITISSSGKGGKGISVDGDLVFNGGYVSVTTTGDQFVYNNDPDSDYSTAAKAIKSDADLTVNDGTIIIRTSKTEAEGLESKATLTIRGGNIDIEAYDDAINASDHIQIDGGYIYCNSQVNDGIDSNGTIAITGGVVIAAGASSPEGGIDCDSNNNFTATGDAVIIGIGGSNNAAGTSGSSLYSVVFNSSSSNVQIVRIETTSGGEEALTFKLPRTYGQRLSLLFCSPALKANTGYTIYTGGSISGGSDFHGYYTGAGYTKGTSAGTFTTSSKVSTVGNSGGGPGGW